MTDQAMQEVETLVDPQVGDGAGTEDGGVSAVVGTIKGVTEVLVAVFTMLQAVDQIKKLTDKWKKEGQERKFWHFKAMTLPVNAGPVEIVISDVDDTANICWNDKYLWTLNRGETRGFKAPLMRGRNVFWFELNNHGGHRYSLIATISQNGRPLRRLRHQGDDEGKIHLVTAEIVGE
jgi:hypothetical protein